MCRPNSVISTEAAQAFIARRPFRRGNTEVVASRCRALLLLHGTVIGENSESRGLHLTMAGWGTMTTAARLNAVMQALGRDARWRRKDGVWHYGDRVPDDLGEEVEV
jgi:hypothetical protein